MGLATTALVRSTGSGASGAATITIDGTGGRGRNDNNGIHIPASGIAVSSVEGAIRMIGQAGGDAGLSGFSNYGVSITSGAKVASTGSGLNAASVTIDGTGAGRLDGHYRGELHRVRDFGRYP